MLRPASFFLIAALSTSAALAQNVADGEEVFEQCRQDLSFADGRQLMSPLHSSQTFPAGGASGVTPRAAVMVSRRQRNPSCWKQESPLLKLLAVLKWMSQR